jgi:hypothetical protein
MALMKIAHTPLVSLLFKGATLTEHDDIEPGAARLGCPAWGRAQLLANIEVRLGLPRPTHARAVRVQRWSRRMAELEAANPGRFYARSYALDPIGTATTILGWRDELVTAGWDGDPIPNGGERLETLRELTIDTDLPPGTADRLRRVEDELRASRTRVFDELLLAEARTLWPGRWQRIFALFEEFGTPVTTREASFEPTAGDSDLERLQALLRGDAMGGRGMRGDGSIVVLRAETPWELGEAASALLRAWGDPSTAVVRSGEERPLDYSLAAHGFASQGLEAKSPWRPALQLLPLAVELAFEPRDPYRMLELLTLPMGPFHGLTGERLAGALAKAPGIGGPAWREAKEEIASVTRTVVTREAVSSGVVEDEAARLAEERVTARLARIAAWLEEPGYPASQAAPCVGLLAVADRVRTWLKNRLGTARMEADGDPTSIALAARADVLATAFAQAQAFHETVSHETRANLDLVDARLLVEQVSSGHTLRLLRERTGRVDHVHSPAGLRRARDVVVWWHCVGGTEWRPSVKPWRRAELDALRTAGVLLPDSAERLTAEAESWHQVLHAARKRLVLAIPRSALGAALEPHPIWDEIVARLEASEADVARVTIYARDLLNGHIAALGSAASPAVMDLGALALPEPRSEWRLDATHLGSSETHSASSVEMLVGCPLQWVLRYPGGLHAGALDSIASGPLLYGQLGHRLVEELHRAGALAVPAEIGQAILARIDRLLREEGSVLLRPGMTFELAQFRDQLAKAITRLAEVLVESKLTVVDVEVAIEVPWRAGSLHGRLDLLLRGDTGRDVVLDLKWGAKSYRELLENGLATQLAVYAAARKAATNARETPAAAYFSLKQGAILATAGAPFAGFRPIRGPSLTDTWAKLERTVHRVELHLREGRVAVTGVRRSVPLLEAMGLDTKDHEQHLAPKKKAACKYCGYGALCGEKWEALA